MRRGNETANSIWGSEASVLVGDFLYSRAFQLMVEVGNARIMRIMADTTNVLAEGEVLQLASRHDPDTSEAPLSGSRRPEDRQAVRGRGPGQDPCSPRCGEADERRYGRFGARVGMAYQLVDDVLDYRGSTAAIRRRTSVTTSRTEPHPPPHHPRPWTRGNEYTVRTVREALRKGDVGSSRT